MRRARLAPLAAATVLPGITREFFGSLNSAMQKSSYYRS
jgi:hypothetical protein